jgi:hypothetical protein
MGALTNTSIISQGMALAARDDLATSALTWLNAWLRSQYAAWPWPFLMKRARNQTLSAGTTSYTFGAGSGGATDWVHQVRDPVLVRSADYGTRNVIRIRQLVGGQPNIDPEWDEDMVNSSTSRALPSYFKVRASTVGGQWILWPQRVPDRDYTISIDYQFLPADMVAGATPIYPGDETMVQLIKAKSYEYSQRLKEAAAAMEEVRQMAVNDRLRWGTVDGTNDQMQLDSKVFR